jgi:DNA mismatch repair protein MutS
MSIAWSILETLHNKNSVKTLFATHYHELVDESQKLKHVDNYSVAV